MTDNPEGAHLKFIEELNISSKELINVMINFDDGVLIADAKGKVLFYNQAMAKIDSLERKSDPQKKQISMLN